MRALIADDDRIATTKLSRTLAKWNFDVSLAHDGESAWSSIQTQAPQLAIVDWMMPAHPAGCDDCAYVPHPPHVTRQPRGRRLGPRRGGGRLSGQAIRSRRAAG